MIKFLTKVAEATDSNNTLKALVLSLAFAVGLVLSVLTISGVLICLVKIAGAL